MERRLFLKGSALGSMVAFFASSNLSAAMLKDKDLLGFKAVSASTQDKVIVPQGYEAKVLIFWVIHFLAKQNLMMKIKSSI
nr:hypothetical protein [Campylobacter jejuni]